MRIALIVVGVLALLIIVMLGIGALLPVDHIASSRATFKAAPVDVWHALTDVATFPEWRSDVKSVELLPAEAGHKRWREHGSNGVITFVEQSAIAPSKLVTRIADEKLPFGGTWSYDLTPAGSGTTVTIREDGSVRNPFFRFMSRFIFGHHATQKQYLNSLANRFGETIEIEEVD